jgi:methionine-S-sulfoxide reductase
MNQIAVFGGGCFWCTEAIFQKIKGVTKVESGYAGGNIQNPDYETVSTGTTGHAEAIKITFDPTVISYENLLFIFFRTHNPTTPNQQGHDIGTQYRSVIFYCDKNQESEAKKAKLLASETYGDPIVTEIIPFKEFYTAEDYHQNYYNENQNQPYCKFVIDPKIKKLQEEFKQYLKD